MQEYMIHLQAENGSFGSARRVWLVGDSEAQLIANRLLKVAKGVDIWRSDKRIALLSRSPSPLHRPYPAAVHGYKPDT